MPLRASVRLLAIWLALAFATFVTGSAHADPALAPKDPFAGASGHVGAPSGDGPHVGAGFGQGLTRPKTPPVTGPISGSVTVQSPPSLVDQITGVITRGLKTNAVKAWAAEALFPGMGNVVRGGQRLEAAGAEHHDSRTQLVGAAFASPGDVGAGVLGEAYDTVKGLAEFGANGITTHARIAAGLATGNLGAANRAASATPEGALARGAASQVKIVAALATGNKPALAKAGADSPLTPLVRGAMPWANNIANTIQHGSGDQRADLLHSAANLAGRVGFEAALAVVPGGIEARAPTIGLRGARVGEELAEGSRLGRGLAAPRGAADPLAAAAERSVDVSKLPPRTVFRTTTEDLFRTDSRPPEEIFRDGFHPKDPSNLSIFGRVERNDPSAFVGATRDPKLNNIVGDYKYDIVAPGGIDANLTYEQMGLINKHAYEQEILFPGGIDTRYIRGVWHNGEYIPNPNFRP